MARRGLLPLSRLVWLLARSRSPFSLSPRRLLLLLLLLWLLMLLLLLSLPIYDNSPR